MGDPARLLIIDTLSMGDASPTELQTALGMPSNLLAHHLKVLEGEGMIATCCFCTCARRVSSASSSRQAKAA